MHTSVVLDTKVSKKSSRVKCRLPAQSQTVKNFANQTSKAALLIFILFVFPPTRACCSNTDITNIKYNKALLKLDFYICIIGATRHSNPKLHSNFYIIFKIKAILFRVWNAAELRARKKSRYWSEILVHALRKCCGFRNSHKRALELK